MIAKVSIKRSNNRIVDTLIISLFPSFSKFFAGVTIAILLASFLMTILHFVFLMDIREGYSTLFDVFINSYLLPPC